MSFLSYTFQWRGCWNGHYWNKRRSSCWFQPQSGLGHRSKFLPWAEPCGSIYLSTALEKRPCSHCLRGHCYAELLINKSSVYYFFLGSIALFCSVCCALHDLGTSAGSLEKLHSPWMLEPSLNSLLGHLNFHNFLIGNIIFCSVAPVLYAWLIL